MTELWLTLFLTANQGWGFEPGIGTELQVHSTYAALTMAATNQHKTAVSDGYTYSITSELYPPWQLAPSVGYTTHGYTGTWSKHDEAVVLATTYRLRKPGGYIRLKYTGGKYGAYSLESSTHLTSSLFLTLSLDKSTAANAIGYTAGLTWRSRKD